MYAVRRNATPLDDRPIAQASHLAQRRDVTIDEVTRAEDLDTLRPVWSNLVEKMEDSSPFLTWDWMRAWWAHYGDRHQLRVLVFRQGSGVLGIAPLHQRRHGIGPLQLRTLAPIGWERGGWQDLTQQLELLFPSEHRLELLARLLSWLRRSRYSAIWIPSVDASAPVPDWLASKVVIANPIFTFQGRALPDTWPAFVASLGRNTRQNANRYPRALLHAGHQCTFRIAAAPDEVVDALPVLFRLHRERAQAAADVSHPDVFRLPQRQAFMRDIGPRLAACGQFKIGLLVVDNQIVAAQAWFEKNRVLYLYYSGYDPSWTRNSVMFVTTLEVIRHGITSGLRRLELLRGTGQHKERWETDSRSQRNMLVARTPRLLKLGLTAREGLARMVRRRSVA